MASPEKNNIPEWATPTATVPNWAIPTTTETVPDWAVPSLDIAPVPTIDHTKDIEESINTGNEQADLIELNNVFFGEGGYTSLDINRMVNNAREVNTIKSRSESVQNMKDAHHNARLQIQMSDHASNIILNGVNDPDTEAIKDLKSRLRPVVEEDSFMGKVALSTIQQTPLLWETAKAGGPGAIGGGLAAGGLATIGALAEPTILGEMGIPTATIAGMKFGGGWTSAARLAQLEAGNFMVEWLDLGGDPNIGRAASVPVGALAGLLEMSKVNTILKTIPGGKRLLGKAVSNVAAKTGKKFAGAMALKYGLQTGTVLTENQLQEHLQQATHEVGLALSKELNNRMYDTHFTQTTKEELIKAHAELTKQTFYTALGLQLPGSTMGMTIDTGRALLQDHSYVKPKAYVSQFEENTTARLTKAKDRIAKASSIEGSSFHPGSMGITEFMKKYRAEVSKKRSDWLMAWTEGAKETPRQMFLRLESEYKAYVDQAENALVDVFDVETPKVSEKLPNISELADEANKLPEKIEDLRTVYHITPEGSETSILAEGLTSGSWVSTRRSQAEALVRSINRMNSFKNNEEVIAWAKKQGATKADIDNALNTQVQTPRAEMKTPGGLYILLMNSETQLVHPHEELWSDLSTKFIGKNPVVLTGKFKGEVQKGKGDIFDMSPTDASEFKWSNRNVSPEAGLKTKYSSSVTDIEQIEFEGVAIGPKIGDLIADIQDLDDINEQINDVGYYGWERIHTPEGSRFSVYDESTGKEVKLFKKRKLAKQFVSENNAERARAETITEVDLMKEEKQDALKEERLKKKIAVSKVDQKRKDQLKAQKERKDAQRKRLEDRKNAQMATLKAKLAMAKEVEGLVKIMNTDVPASVGLGQRKVIETLQRKSYRDMTYGELKSTVGEIKRLTAEGKAERKQQLADQKARIDSDVSAMNDRHKEPNTKSSKYAQVRDKQGFNYWYNPQSGSIRMSTLVPQNLFDLLDGGKATYDGPHHEVFINRVNEAIDSKLRMVDQRHEAANNVLAEAGVTTKDLYKTVWVNGEKWSKSQIIGAYNFMKNDLARAALTHGNEKTLAYQEFIRDYVEKKEPWMRKVADGLIIFHDESYGRSRDRLIETENRDMGREKNYTPMWRTDLDWTPEDFTAELLERDKFYKEVVDKGFSITRENIPDRFQTALNLDAWEVVMSSIERQENHYAMAKPLQEMSKVINDPTFRKSVKDSYGSAMLEEVDAYYTRVVNPNHYRKANNFARRVRALKRNAAVSYLAYSIKTMLKQPASYFMYSAHAGVKNMTKAVHDYAWDPVGIHEFVNKNDSQILHNTVEEEMQFIRTNQPGVYNKLLRKVGHEGMKGIIMMDRATKTIGWYATYKQEMGKHGNHDRAVTVARDVTLRTQPGAMSHTLPSIYSQSDYLNVLQQFTTQLNRNYNAMTYELPANVRNKNFGKAIAIAGSVGLQGLVVWSISNRRLPDFDDPTDDIMDAMKEQALSMVPVFGKSALSAYSGYESEILLDVLAKPAGLALKGGDIDSQKIKALTEAGAIILGAPYLQPKRVLTAAEEEDLFELFGPEVK